MQPKKENIQVFSAPSKLFLAGEYAVTKAGYHALVFCVPKYTHIFLQASSCHSAWLSSSLYQEKFLLPSFSSQEERERFEKSLQTSEGQTSPFLLLLKAYVFLHRFFQEEKIDFQSFSLHIETELFSFQNQPPKKYGLGSSASVLVAFFKAVLGFHKKTLSKEALFKLLALFYMKENIGGSLADVACIVFEEAIVYRNFDRAAFQNILSTKDTLGIKDYLQKEWRFLQISPLSLPHNLHILAFWSQTDASSSKLVQKTPIPASFYEESEKLVDALKNFSFEKKDALLFLTYIEKCKHLLRSLQAYASVDLEPDALKAICEQASLPHSASKWSGAGGGDCALLFTFSLEEKERLKKTVPFPLLWESSIS